MSDYERISAAIEYLVDHSARQPGLADVAAHVHLSPYHFQRLFLRWTGVSPKRLLQVVTVERAKQLLLDSAAPLLDASERLGLSSASRLYDHFVSLEAVTPAEFRRAGGGLTMRYGHVDSPFGDVFIASTHRGICVLSFTEPDAVDDSIRELSRTWPAAGLVEDRGLAETTVARVFSRPPAGPVPLSVLVRGTNFQVAVWRALLKIPPGRLASYRDVAAAVGRPKAVRAVGSAVGANPCAFLIPCHRVIRANGELGGYRWGPTRKQAINVWEAAATEGMLAEC